MNRYHLLINYLIDIDSSREENEDFFEELCLRCCRGESVLIESEKQSSDECNYLLLNAYVNSVPKDVCSVPWSNAHFPDVRLNRRKTDDDLRKDFEQFKKNYKRENALYWYTSNHFFNKIFNRACRTEDVLEIYRFRSYIKDLCEQLSNLHIDYIRNLKSAGISTFTCYRGQLISKKEINELQNNIGKFFLTNSFLSTSLDKDAAYCFCDRSGQSVNTDNYEAVFFSYVIDINISSKPYADIQCNSKFKDEEEVLFSMGTIFRNDSINYCEENNTWYVSMSLVSTTNTDFEEAKPNFDTMQDRSILLMLADFAEGTKNGFTQAEHLYRLALQNQGEPFWYYCKIYNTLARLCKENGQYAAAIDNYTMIVNISEHNIHSYPNIALENIMMSNLNIAKIYSIVDYSQAIPKLNEIVENNSYDLK
ncbi:unnamed protein product, partial [Rotaria sp. Silwood1]